MALAGVVRLHRQTQGSIQRASIAQMVERKTLNLVVVGSSPTEGAFFLSRYTAKNFLNRNQKLKVQL